MEISKVRFYRLRSASSAEWSIQQLIPTMFMHFDMKLTDPEDEWSVSCKYVKVTLLGWFID